MIKHVGHGGILRRIAINVGAGYLPGINTIITGAPRQLVCLDGRLSESATGLKDCCIPIVTPMADWLPSVRKWLRFLIFLKEAPLVRRPGSILFRTRLIMIRGIDHSDKILKRLKEENIDALISVVGNQGLGILYKLHRKGLHTVCIPKSIENDIAATSVSFGFNSALSFTIEMLGRARQAARSARKIAVVEVIGEQAGWLALQAGIAISADAVLIARNSM